MKAVDGDEWPEDKHKRAKLERMVVHFQREGGALLYDAKLCVPRKHVSTVLRQAHDSRIGGHFGRTKTLLRLSYPFWDKKSCYVTN